MITIQLDGLKAIDHWLESMVEAIDDLQHHGIPDELSEWQRSDVHRKRAFTKHTRSGARTLFRPHSRYESMPPPPVRAQVDPTRYISFRDGQRGQSCVWCCGINWSIAWPHWLPRS